MPSFSLSAGQKHLVAYAVDIALESERLPSILLHGPRGTGRRLIAEAIARELDLDFVPVTFDGPLAESLTQLVGTIEEADRAEERGAFPGVLGTMSPTLVYLTEVQVVPAELVSQVRMWLRDRRYLDANGVSRRFSEHMLIVGGYRENERLAEHSLDSYLISGFDYRIEVALPDASSLEEIAKSLWSSRLTGQSFPNALTELLPFARVTPTHLHALKRWIDAVASASVSGQEILQEFVLSLPTKDLDYIMREVRYKGRDLTSRDARDWLKQFTPSVQPLLLHLLATIGSEYYVSEGRGNELMMMCIENSGITPGSSVSFCLTERMGKSSQHIAHEIKTASRWRPNEEIDLRSQSRRFPTFLSEPAWAVIADDFVGSGSTIRGWIDTGAVELLEYYPKMRLCILILVGFESALRELNRLVVTFGDRVRLVVGRVLDDSDRCFTEVSNIVISAGDRTALQECCQSVASEHFPKMLRDDFYLGFGKVGSLVVFSYYIPNNTLPILWFDAAQEWRPIFPASGWPRETIRHADLVR